MILTESCTHVRADRYRRGCGMRQIDSEMFT